MFLRSNTVVHSQNRVKEYIALDVDYIPAKAGGFLIRVLSPDSNWYPVAGHRDELKARSVTGEIYDSIKYGKSEYYCGEDEYPYRPNWIPYPEY